MKILKLKFNAVQAVFGDQQNQLSLSRLIIEHTFFDLGLVYWGSWPRDGAWVSCIVGRLSTIWPPGSCPGILRGRLSLWQLMTRNYTICTSPVLVHQNPMWHLNVFSEDGWAGIIIHSHLQCPCLSKRKGNWHVTDNPSRQMWLIALLRHQALCQAGALVP